MQERIFPRPPGLRRHPRSSVTLAGAVSLTVLCSAAHAQEIQEVTVTAQKREQNIQNVPIAITAFTADTLKEKSIGDINALSNLTPNVNLDASSPFSGDSSVLSASIRGVGQDDFAFNMDPGVGVYLDGVYLARTIGANQNLLDVDRIEILKGPQGTLFGRNTIGGAINIVTHTPGPERRFEAQATTGRFNRRDFALSTDVPLNDNLFTTLTVSSSVRDGYQRSIPYPEGSVYASTPFVTDAVGAYPKSGYDSSDANGGLNQQVVRGKMLWNASEKLSVTFAADWQHQNQPSTPVTTLRVFPTTGLFSGIYHFCISNPASVLDTILPDDPRVIAAIPGFPQLGQTTPVFNTTNGLCGPRVTGTPFGQGGAPLGGAGYVGGPGGGLALSGQPRLYWDENAVRTGSIDTTYSNGVSFAKHDAFGGSITADYDLTDDVLLKSITGYRQISWEVGIDLDGTPEQLQEVTDAQHQYQVSQEFQLTGSAMDNRLDYVAGLYYFREAGYVHDFVPFEGILYVYDYANDIDTESYAAFFHTDFKITDRFTASFGGRYSYEQKLFEGGQADLNGFSYKLFGCPPDERPAVFPVFGGVPNTGNITCREFIGFPEADQPLRYFPAGEQKQIFRVFTPKIGAQFFATDDVMLYASWSKGFKSGGWTTRLSNPILDGSEAEFKPEYNKTTELGIKSELFGNRMLVNAAVFYSEYSDIQLNVQQGPSPVMQNAGDATIKGAEIEMQAIVGGGFSFNFAGGYIDAEYDFVNPDTLIPADAALPKTPEYKFTVGPAYEFGLANGARMRLRADFTHTAEMFNDSLNTPELRRPSSNALAAAIHYLSPSERYEVVLGGTNLTNDRYLTTGSINLGAGQMSGTYNRPKEWYLTFRAKFDGLD
ncbi:MAG: TonB-dependent receptor [Steroidobacteraceae bacterium]|nr:TonB-dependent receptor [Steroidobacteraceae bacterium]